MHKGENKLGEMAATCEVCGNAYNRLEDRVEEKSAA